MSASRFRDVVEEMGYPRVRVRDGVRQADIRSPRQWFELIRQVEGIEHARRTNPCVIVQRGASPASMREADGAAIESSLHDCPLAIPTPEQRAIVDAALQDAGTILRLPRLRVRFVRRARGDTRLAVASLISASDQLTVGLTFAIDAAEPLARLRKTALHELRHAADLGVCLHLSADESQLERRADDFAAFVFPMRLAPRSRAYEDALRCARLEGAMRAG